MGLIHAVKRYKTKLEKRFSRKITRRQVNFACDQSIILGVKLMAKSLEVPVYVICEHLLQAGAEEIAVIIQDEALKEQLCRHLVRDHLLVPAVNPGSEPVSRRRIRLRNALQIVDIMDTVTTAEKRARIILRLWQEATAGRERSTSAEPDQPGAEGTS